VNGEKTFNTVYIHLGAIRVIWAGVVFIWTKVMISLGAIWWGMISLGASYMGA